MTPAFEAIYDNQDGFVMIVSKDVMRIAAVHTRKTYVRTPHTVWQSPAKGIQ